MEKKYSIWKGLGKSLIQVVIFGLPLLVTSLETMPQTAAWMDLTVGGVLSVIVNFLKTKTKEAGML
jgi:hypothetical protein